MPASLPRKKIAFVLPSLAAGGAERVLITLMNHLDPEKFLPEFITLSDQGPSGAWIAPHISRHALGEKRVRSGLAPLAGLLRRIKPDTVVSTMAHMNFGVLLLRPFLGRRVRLVVREANVPSSILQDATHPFFGRSALVRAAYKTLYPTADLVISPSQRILEEFSTRLHMSVRNHALLYNPVDEERIRASLSPFPRAAPFGASTVVFAAAGRLHRQKGFDRLVATLSGGFAMPDGLDWRLDLLGEGPERPALERQIQEAGLENRITLRGLVTPPWPWMAAADAFLLPSRWEGLPNVILEALCAGTKTIATAEAGGIAEIAAATAPGTVTVAEDMEAFTEAMRRVRPAPGRDARASLLPDAFRLPRIMASFQAMV